MLRGGIGCIIWDNDHIGFTKGIKRISNTAAAELQALQQGLLGHIFYV